ncbi:MAG: NAD-dependent deacylase [Anaerolineae bacterium]|nr:NAD-dependent deacylase [Anaerolineae bacterium]
METSPTNQRGLQDAAALLRHSAAPAALTGAGVSRESGIPTFREAQTGLWAQYDPTELATPEAFHRNPELVWQFYQSRRADLAAIQPNPGHYALAAFETRYPDFSIITQNVDDLHERAGSKNVIRLHGRLSANKCSADCKGNPTPIDYTGIESLKPPPCPHCGAPLRPDVVWFNEMLPPREISLAGEICASADVLLVIGTSGMVSPASLLPAAARSAGAMIIEINPQISEISRIAHVHIAAPSGQALPALLRLLESTSL